MAKKKTSNKVKLPATRYVIYELLRKVEESSKEKILEQAEKKKINRIKAEEVLEAMKTHGLVYEPRSGILKLIE